MDQNPSTTLYDLVLSLHSILRWGVFFFGAVVLLQSLLGMVAAGELGKLGKRLGLAFMVCLDLQVLLGVLLYLFLSPVTAQARHDMGAAMKDPEMRYWVVEHGAVMILALIFVHLGRILARRAKNERSAHMRRFLTTAIALGLMFVRTPWPFTEIHRDWIRWPF